MKMPICPTCQKIKLIRSRALTSTNDPNSGKEYLACPRCSAKWYMDDPNRPVAAIDVKPKKSIWQTLATWGAPHNEPDAFGVLHPMTYVFPPRHEYPSPFLPPSTSPRQPDLIPPKSPESKPSAPSEPVPGPSTQPASPAAKLVLLSPREPQADPPPPAEQITPVEEQIQKEDQVQAPSQEVNQTPSETPQESQPADLENPPQPGELIATTPGSVLDMNSEEQARFELLSRIANSPLPPLLDTQRKEMYEPSIISDNYQPSVASQTGSESLSPEEQHLYETLLRIAATPGPLSPMIYPRQTSSPKDGLQELTSAESFREDLDNADRVRRQSERIEHAIQKSPFLSPHGLQTPREKWVDSPKLSQLKSPASKHSGLRSLRHSIALSVPPTPRSARKSISTPRSPYIDDHPPTPRSTRKSFSAPRSPYVEDHQPTPRSTKKSITPRSPYVDDQLPLPGAFPTPKPMPLTSEALGRHSRQSSRLAASDRSRSIATSLPAPPSNYETIPQSQVAKRGSITSATRSPLFN